MLPFRDDYILSLCLTLHVLTYFYSFPLPVNQCLLSAASPLACLPWVPVELCPNCWKDLCCKRNREEQNQSAGATIKETVYVNHVIGFFQYLFKRSSHHRSRMDKFADKTCISSKYRVMYRVIPWSGRVFLHLTVDYGIITNYVQLYTIQYFIKCQASTLKLCSLWRIIKILGKGRKIRWFENI